MRRRDVLGAAAALLASPAGAQPAASSAISDFERGRGGRIGVYVHDIVSGRKLAWRANDRFVMCSTFKASLAACVLERVDRGRDRLDEPVRYGPADMQDWYAPVAQANLTRGELTVGEMCAAAVERSDNTCASLLLARVGGPPAVTAFWRRIGDTVSRLDDPEPILNRTPPGGVRNTTSPAAMAGVLQRLALGDVLAGPSRERLVGWLVGCRTGDDRLRAGLPVAWRVGDKTGNNGRDAAGDIAVVWPEPHRPIVVAAYTRGGSPSAPQLDAVFKGVGELVAQRFG